jgi:hypothetical protein
VTKSLKRITWLLFLALFIAALSVVVFAFPTFVSGSSGASPREARPSDPGDLDLGPSGESGGQIQSSSIMSSFLPIVLGGFQPSIDTPFGVEIWNVSDMNLARMRAAGIRWVRMQLYWSQIEPVNTTPQYYYWPPQLDKNLATLAANDIQVILTIMGNPSWAATYPAGPIDRVDMSEFSEFMSAVVARYGAGFYNVKYWEFYNEPDNGDEFRAGYGGWGFFGYQPQAYVDILSAVYGPMKAADPEAQIVFGGIAYDNWTETGGPFVRSFLDEVLQAGGGAYFDVMNFHYYPAFRANWDPYGRGIIGKATYLRDKLAEYGADKPFICTEVSMWSDEAHGGSNELQSRYVAQVFARTLVADLGVNIWFQLVDDYDLGSWKYGLLNPDYSPKPSFYAYQTAVRQLDRVSFVQNLDVGAIEAYEFQKLSGLTHIIVAWTNDDSTQQLAIEAAQVVRVDKLGGETVVSDGDDGALDGVVHVNVGPSPVYLRFSP